MLADEALRILDQVLPDFTLTNLQESIFCQVWEGKTYAEIAEYCNYEHSYIRDVGFKLWQSLSEAFGQKVSKSNIRSVVTRFVRTQQPTVENHQSPQVQHSIETEMPPLDSPNGPVPLHSKLYIERPPIENQVYQEILKPGSLIRIKAPRQMGKTSLLRRIIAHAHHHQIRTLSLSLHRADRTVFSSLDRFLQWLCANLSRQLGLEPKLDQYWYGHLGSKVSCTAYFEEYLLREIQGPLAIALDEVNELFEYPEIAGDFFPLLRTWFEDAQELEHWHRVRWVIAHATDVYVPLKLNQSPFNVGLAIKLPEFTVTQVQDLALRHGLDWVAAPSGLETLKPLLAVIGCSPGLVRQSLYQLACHPVDLEQFIAESTTQAGIFSSHLRQLLAALYPHEALQLAFKQVIDSEEAVTLDPITAYRLESIGLVKLEGNQVKPSCELYRQYFSAFLPVNHISNG